jgi:hypothetical protein
MDAIYNLKRKLDESPIAMDWLDSFLYRRIYSNDIHFGLRAVDKKCVVNGCDFLEAIFPYSDFYFYGCDLQIKYVDPYQVMAGQYRAYAWQLSANEELGVLDRLDGFADHAQHDDKARYVQVGDFPIYRAYEGKNRVSLYRKHERHIKAAIQNSEYPPPGALELVRVRLTRDCYCLVYHGHDSTSDRTIKIGIFGLLKAALSGRVHYKTSYSLIERTPSRTIKIIPFNESVAVLEAYGVGWGKPIVSITALLKRRICRQLVGQAQYRR